MNTSSIYSKILLVINMEYKLGNSKTVRSRGDTYDIICPQCNKLVQFGVFSNLERKLVVDFPPLDLNTVFFLVCPECASIFTVDEKTGEKFLKHREDISENDLKKLEIYKNNI